MTQAEIDTVLEIGDHVRFLLAAAAFGIAWLCGAFSWRQVIVAWSRRSFFVLAILFAMTNQAKAQVVDSVVSVNNMRGVWVLGAEIVQGSYDLFMVFDGEIDSVPEQGIQLTVTINSSGSQTHDLYDQGYNFYSITDDNTQSIICYALAATMPTEVPDLLGSSQADAHTGEADRQIVIAFRETIQSQDYTMFVDNIKYPAPNNSAASFTLQNTCTGGGGGGGGGGSGGGGGGSGGGGGTGEIDSDGDGVPDVCDVCPLDAEDLCIYDQTDADGDGVPVEIDDDDNDASVGCSEGGTGVNTDSDGDGTPDNCDVCPNDPNDDCDYDQTDADGDGVPAEIDADDNDPNVGCNPRLPPPGRTNRQQRSGCTCESRTKAEWLKLFNRISAYGIDLTPLLNKGDADVSQRITIGFPGRPESDNIVVNIHSNLASFTDPASIAIEQARIWIRYILELIFSIWSIYKTVEALIR